MKKLLILAVVLCLVGCDSKRVGEVTVSGSIKSVREHCINGYIFYTVGVGHTVGITQVFELVDGVTKPKICEDVWEK